MIGCRQIDHFSRSRPRLVIMFCVVMSQDALNPGQSSVYQCFVVLRFQPAIAQFHSDHSFYANAHHKYLYIILRQKEQSRAEICQSMCHPNMFQRNVLISFRYKRPIRNGQNAHQCVRRGLFGNVLCISVSSGLFKVVIYIDMPIQVRSRVDLLCISA